MPKTKKTQAAKADKYHCYQESVQEPSHEVEFFEQAYADFNRRKPRHLREDFCGTFAVCCDWVKGDPKRTALGVDLDPECLNWGREHNLAKLDETTQKRVKLRQQDVRQRNRPAADILAAQNFSFWIFRTREELRDYFKAARSNLAPGGILVTDMMGGGECYEEEHEDVRKIGKGKKAFKYVWTQDTFNPINHDARFHISFRFKDGSALDEAFVYEWRFWTIPEVRELMAEAGFSSSHVYWEVDYETDEEAGTWERREDAPSDPSWVCYIVAVR